MQTKKPVIIIGAGLGGIFMALCLAKRGYKVSIYERFSQERLTEEASNRSFNLTFYARGIQALKKAGLWNLIQPQLWSLKGSAAYFPYGTVYTEFDTTENPQYVIERPAFLQLLLQEAIKQPNISFHFDTQLISVDRNARTITTKKAKTDQLQTVACDIVIGADGINSVVRPFIQNGRNTSHKQEFLPWTYKQVKIPAHLAAELGWKERTENFVHAEDALLLSFPNVDGSFTAMFLLPENATYRFAALTNEKLLKQFLQKTFPNLAPAHDVFIQSFLSNPEGRLSTITTQPWYYKDFLVLIGDSAHGLLPFYGQGTAAAFEDCLTIVSLLDAKEGVWRDIFPLYQAKRKPNTDLLAYFSKESFDRLMRYKQADIQAIKSKFDAILNSMFPKLWLPPIYNMIADDASDFQEILAKHAKRQKLARWLGITAGAYGIYAALLLKEKLSSITKK